MLRSFPAVKTKKCVELLMLCLYVAPGAFAQKSAATQAAPGSGPVNPAQMPSSNLCALIDCHQPPKPVITGIDPGSAITPGGQMVVIGKNFNSNDGKNGHLLLAIGSKSGVTRRIRIGGSSSFSQPYKEAYLTVMGWSDGHAYGQIPSDITGVIDGGATMQVIRSDGTASDPFEVSFNAARELRRMLPASDMKTDSCSKNGDENQCNSWADFSDPWSTAGHSVVGLHDKFLQNMGAPESSSDYYSFNLANGWAWGETAQDTYNFAYLGCTTDSLGIQAFDYTSTSGKLKFDWKINCSIAYTFEVYINGPIGVPWK